VSISALLAVATGGKTMRKISAISALVAAVEEERFNRIKHAKLANVDNPHQFPERAIRCLPEL
jgi:predicted NodU family carbamoyl transferase